MVGEPVVIAEASFLEGESSPAVLERFVSQSRNASAVSDAPPPTPEISLPLTTGRVRYSCLKEAAGEEALMQIQWGCGDGKTGGIGGGANRSAGRIGPIVVCVRKFEARSLVGGNKGAPRLQDVCGAVSRGQRASL